MFSPNLHSDLLHLRYSFKVKFHLDKWSARTNSSLYVGLVTELWWDAVFSVIITWLNCVCAGWRRDVLPEGQPGPRGYSRGLAGLPPPEQRGSGWAPPPACHHPGALRTGTHSTTQWWGTHTHRYVHAYTHSITVETLIRKCSFWFYTLLTFTSHTGIVCTVKSSQGYKIQQKQTMNGRR